VGEKANHLISLISIVDDDPSMCEATISLLKSCGFTAQVFHSAEEFLNSPHSAQTKCLILDVQMPGMSGLQLQRRLVAETRRIPIIFISAHEDQNTRNEAMRSGAFAFLAKPFCAETLLAAIRSALDGTPSQRP
jgi:FixJ family two-component response regulator